MTKTSLGSYPRQAAFTLTEILLVIAILLATTAVVYAAFGPARARARETTCMSKLRQVGQAITMYRSDMDGNEAVVGKPSTCEELGLPCDESLFALFKQYDIDQRIYSCPDYKGQYGPGLVNTFQWYMNKEGLDLPEPYNMTSRTRKYGEATIIVVDDSHNRLFNIQREPNWTQKRVLVLRLNGGVDPLSVPYNSTAVDR